MLILDVGCGVTPRGNVNIDLFTGRSPHLRSRELFINPSTIPNFIKADCNFLPFKDRVFDESVASHVIEHKGVKPIQTIREMVRVTNGRVRIIVPHRYRDKYCQKCKVHARHFSKKSFTELLRRMGLVFEIKVKYCGFPFRYVQIFRKPIEMEAIIQTWV